MVTAFFVDTSALAKRYLAEPGSVWVLSWIVPEAGNVIFISELALVETRSLFMRLTREGKLTASDAVLLYGNFLAHMQAEYVPVLMSSVLLTTASSLVEKYAAPPYALRSLDSLQPASAIGAEFIFGEKLTFVSSDNRLLAAASAEGFAIDNPYQHP